MSKLLHPKIYDGALEAIFQLYSPVNRKRCLLLAAALILVIAVVDWLTKPYMSLGFLYLFPVLLMAGFLSRWQVALLGLGCALLNELFSALGSRAEIPRTAMVTIALSGGGLFFRELIRNRELVAAHMRALEEQIRLRQDAEGQLQILVDTSPAAILNTDQSGTILLANHSAQTLLAPDGHLIQGDRIADYLPDFRDLFPAVPLQAYRTAMQCSAKRSGGDEFLAEVWFSTYVTVEGPRLAAIIVDLSEELQNQDNKPAKETLDQAAKLLDAAAAQIRQMESSVSGSRARAGATSTTPVGELASPVKRLTQREVETLRLVFEGLTNKEIGARLTISESAVKATLQQLFSKSGVRTRSQLVRFALAHYQHEL